VVRFGLRLCWEPKTAGSKVMASVDSDVSLRCPTRRVYIILCELNEMSQTQLATTKKDSIDVDIILYRTTNSVWMHKRFDLVGGQILKRARFCGVSCIETEADVGNQI